MKGIDRHLVKKKPIIMLFSEWFLHGPETAYFLNIETKQLLSTYIKNDKCL